LFVEHEEDEPGLGRSDPKLDPALLVVERLIGEHAEADALGPEFQRAILIARRDADELHMRDHAEKLTTWQAAAQGSSLSL
jgi:hypothetical protein